MGCESVGIGLRTLICRQILEMASAGADSIGAPDETKTRELVTALVKVMQGTNLSLSSCATAALVNLSSGNMNTKTFMVSQGIIRLVVRQLKMKDDDLTLYSLYLIVNLTKTAHHRAIVVREAGVPIIVDVLTSSYQNLRKERILTEVA